MLALCAPEELHSAVFPCIIEAPNRDSVSEVLMVLISLFGDFLEAPHSHGTWRKVLHTPVPSKGAEIRCSHERDCTKGGKHLVMESGPRRWLSRQQRLVRRDTTLVQ